MTLEKLDISADRAKLKAVFTELAQKHPDVFRRGVAALLPGAVDMNDPKVRAGLAQIQDPKVLEDALKNLEKQTSEQEVDELLAGGR